MEQDQSFLNYLQAFKKPFSGWDFSLVEKTGRMRSSLLSWSYGSLALPLIQDASSILDMGTGGGEFLSLLRPFPEVVYATEGYKPNIPIAKKRLEPLGVTVVSIDDDTHLPLDSGRFHLILNQHESYSPKEVRRVMKPGGIFLTQQVGGLNCIGINKALGAPVNKNYLNWNLAKAVGDLKTNQFDIVYRNEEYPIQRFYDIGALVYYLKAIPWQVDNFSIEAYEKELYAIHREIQTKGYFDVEEHRFIIKAKAI